MRLRFRRGLWGFFYVEDDEAFYLRISRELSCGEEITCSVGFAYAWLVYISFCCL
jgi:hypothetical protein